MHEVARRQRRTRRPAAVRQQLAEQWAVDLERRLRDRARARRLVPDAAPIRGQQPGDDALLDRVGVVETSSAAGARADRPRLGGSPACRAARRRPLSIASGVTAREVMRRLDGDCGRSRVARYDRRRSAATQRRPTQVGDPRGRRAGHHRRGVHGDDRCRRRQGRRRVDRPRALPLLVEGRSDHGRRAGSPATTTRSFATRSPTGPGRVVHRLDRVLCGSLPSDPSDGSWLLWIETWGETRRLPTLREAMAELTEHEIDVIHRLFAEGATAGEFVVRRPGAARRRDCRRFATVSRSSRRCSVPARRPRCSSTSSAAASATSSGCHASEYDRLHRDQRVKTDRAGTRRGARAAARAERGRGVELRHRARPRRRRVERVPVSDLAIARDHRRRRGVGTVHRAAAEHDAAPSRPAVG